MMGGFIRGWLRPILGINQESAELPSSDHDGNWIRRFWIEIFSQQQDRAEHKGEFERVTLEDWKKSALELEARIKAQREADVHAHGEYMRMLAENDALVGYRVLVENHQDLPKLWVRRQHYDELERELSKAVSQRTAYAEALQKIEEDWERLLHKQTEPQPAAPVKAKRAPAKKKAQVRKRAGKS